MVARDAAKAGVDEMLGQFCSAARRPGVGLDVDLCHVGPGRGRRAEDRGALLSLDVDLGDRARPARALGRMREDVGECVDPNALDAHLVLGPRVRRVHRMSPGGAHHVECGLAGLCADGGSGRLPHLRTLEPRDRGLKVCSIRRLGLVRDDAACAVTKGVCAEVALVRAEIDHVRVSVVARVRIIHRHERERGPVDLVVVLRQEDRRGPEADGIRAGAAHAARGVGSKQVDPCPER